MNLTDTQKAKIIRQIVSNYYEVDPESLKSKCRIRNKFVEPRQFCFYFCKKKTKLSFSQIGKPFGKDHSTALYGNRTISNLIEVDGLGPRAEEMDKLIEAAFNEIREPKIKLCPHCGGVL